MFAFVTLVMSFGIKMVPPLSMNRTDRRNAWGAEVYSHFKNSWQ